MKRMTFYFPLQMITYFRKAKKRTGLPVATQIRAILQTYIDTNPL